MQGNVEHSLKIEPILNTMLMESLVLNLCNLFRKFLGTNYFHSFKN